PPELGLAPCLTDRLPRKSVTVGMRCILLETAARRGGPAFLMPLPAGVYPAAELARVRSLPRSTTVPKKARKDQGPSPARQASPENPTPAAPAGETNTAYFRRFFKKNRGLLKERSNDAALSR